MLDALISRLREKVSGSTKKNIISYSIIQSSFKIHYIIEKKKPLNLITAADIPPGLDPEDVALMSQQD
jgi:hypothetical protein